MDNISSNIYLAFPALVLSSWCRWACCMMVEGPVLVMLYRTEADILWSKFLLQFLGQVGRSLLNYFPFPLLFIWTQLPSPNCWYNPALFMNNLIYFILFVSRNKKQNCITCKKGMVDTQVNWYFSHTCVSKLNWPIPQLLFTLTN